VTYKQVHELIGRPEKRLKGSQNKGWEKGILVGTLLGGRLHREVLNFKKFLPGEKGAEP